MFFIYYFEEGLRMRTKPILKLIKSLHYHVNNHDSYKIDYDIRHVIQVTRHFQGLSTKMTKYPDMDVSKKIARYTNGLRGLLNKYPAYPNFQPKIQRQFVDDLLKCYCFIYFDLQDHCQAKAIHATGGNKANEFKRKRQMTENGLKKSNCVILDTRFAPDGSLIIKYVPKAQIKKILD